MGRAALSIPRFEYPLAAHEGRVERAVFTLRAATAEGHTVAAVMVYLKAKGCSDAEITEALLRANFLPIFMP